MYGNMIGITNVGVGASLLRFTLGCTLTDTSESTPLNEAPEILCEVSRNATAAQIHEAWVDAIVAYTLTTYERTLPRANVLHPVYVRGF